MYVVDIHGDIRCDTEQEAVALVFFCLGERKLKQDDDWRWPMHQPVFQEAEGA